MAKKIIVVILCSLYWAGPAGAAEWASLMMQDYQGHLFHASSELAAVSAPKLGRYSMANLFDQSLASCWAEAASDDGRGSELVFDLPAQTKFISLANGHQKNEKLFRANNRIASLQVAILLGINRPGEVTETHTLLQTIPFPWHREVSLQDSMGLQQIPIGADWHALAAFRRQQVRQFRQLHHITGSLNVYYLARLTIKTTFSGLKYNDTCLAEIKYNRPSEKISKIYLNAKEDSILLATAVKKNIVLAHDQAAVFQIIATSPANNWLVVIKMANTPSPRAETIYELYNTELRLRVKQSLLGNEVGDLYDFAIKDRRLHLVFLNKKSLEIEELDLSRIRQALGLLPKNR